MENLTPTRLLRAAAQRLDPGRFALTERQQARETWLLGMAESLIALFSRKAITLSTFCRALRLSPAIFRFHFADMDALMDAITSRHVCRLNAALDAIGPAAVDAVAQTAATYRALTQDADGKPTASHSIFLHQRHHLPADIRDPLDAWYASVVRRFPILAALDQPHQTPAREPGAIPEPDPVREPEPIREPNPFREPDPIREPDPAKEPPAPDSRRNAPAHALTQPQLPGPGVTSWDVQSREVLAWEGAAAEVDDLTALRPESLQNRPPGYPFAMTEADEAAGLAEAIQALAARHPTPRTQAIFPAGIGAKRLPRAHEQEQANGG